MKSALVVLATGAEEMETTIVVDVLRRAQIQVVVAGLDGTLPVTCSRGVKILPDVGLGAVTTDFDVIVLPGGAAGAQRLAESPEVGSRLRAQYSSGRLVAAICAAPLALEAHGIAPGATITSHPSVRERLSSYALSDERVVASGTLITSQGPGTSFEFALKLVATLVGDELAKEVAKPLVLCKAD
jgi:protein DJ-1